MADDIKLSLKKIKFDNKDDEFFLYSRHQLGKRLSITLFNVKDTEIYHGDLSEIDLRSMAATRRMIYSDFLSDTIGAITYSDSAEVQYLYSFDNDAGDHYFRWKKNMKSEDIKLNLGRVRLSRADFSSVFETVFSQLSAELFMLGKSLQQAKAELEESNKEKEKAKDLVQTAVKMKDDMEKELYSKFVIILNKKKEKIRQLKGQVTLSVPQNESEEEIVGARRKKRTKNTLAETPPKRVVPRVAIHSESEDSEDTDEEFNRPGPSTCHHSLSSSLLLDDDEPDEECPVQQPRQRHPQTSQKVNKVDSPHYEPAVCDDDDDCKLECSGSTNDSIENLIEML